MMNPRNNKKSRWTSSRRSRGKGVEQQLSVEGVYTNHHFMHTAGTLVGLTVQVFTKTKEVFEGVLATFGPKFQVVLDLPHPVSSMETLLVTNAESVKSKMIFEAEDIVVIKAINVDLEFATRESFAVDGAISGRFNGQAAAPERELEPWQGEDEDADSCVGSDLGDGTENGWDANDMFRKNREKYGVITTYSPDMEGYTTPLQRRDTREWREREARAQQIARQIETSPSAQARARLENGEGGDDDDDDRDEEDKFSAVVRPDATGATAPHSGKYMPPQRRKPQGGPGARQPPRGTPSPQGGGPAAIPGAPPSGRFNTGPPSQGNPAPSSVSPPAPYAPPPTQPAQKTPHPAHKPTLPPQPHSVPGDPKVNGDAKDSRRREAPPPGPQQPVYIRGETAPPHKEGAYHPSAPHHPHHHPQQGAYQPHPGPPPPYHGGPPPEGRRSEPREQREPRKPRPLKEEEEVANLKKFGQDFKLATGGPPDKKGGAAPPPQQQPPQSHHPHQAPPPMAPVSKVHLPPQAAPPTTSGPSHPQPTGPSPPQQHKTETPAATGTGNPPAGIPHPHNAPHGGAPPSVPPSRPEEGKPPSGATQGGSHPPEDEKVVSSKLNPNAKPFSPRSPSTTTPPRVQTPQIPPPTGSQGAAGGPSVAFQPNMVHPAYVMAAQPFPVPQHRFPNKRGPVGNQRQEYTSPVQVAAATGPPILAQAPLTPITTHQTVPLPQTLMQQTHQYQYAGMPMMVRLSHTPGLPAMVPAIVPTSMGLYYPGGEAPAGAQGHNPQHMYVAPSVHHHHQGHHVATPVPHPGQPPTPQGHSGGGGGPPPNMPTQPPTPGPTPPQGMMYSGPTGAPMGGQPTIPQHLSQHSPHNAQSPHNPYQPHAAMAAHAASHAHAAPATQLVMIPPQMNHHMMPPGVPPPHSGAGHAPTSAAGYTPTSSATMPHVNHAHPLHYIPGGASNQVHSIPLVHHNQ